MTTQPSPPPVPEAPVLSDADLAAIEARANAATRGLWTAQSGRYDDLHFGDCGPAAGVTGEHLRGFYVPGFRREDAEFIAHAREDVPALLAALAAERQRADEAETKLTQLREHALDSNPALRTLHSHAVAYLDAVAALSEVRGGAPLSTTLAWMIRQGYLVPAAGDRP